MLVMTFVTKTLSAVSGGAARAAAHSVTGTKNLVRAFVHRREVMRLSELDERGLKDIGLVRSDIDGALVGGASLDADEFVKIVRFRDQ